MRLSGKTIAFCVTGGIAVYKACDVVSRLVKLGADVHVVMTENAKQFVSPLTFESLSRNKVISRMFDADREWEVEHIALAKRADIFVIAPCTANVVGKLASGIADDFLTTTVMAFTGRVLIAPAMNTNMYMSTSYKESEAKLRERGFKFIEPTCGRLACGDVGAGKLAEVDTIVQYILDELSPKQDYIGKTVLVTMGATREPIDPVRFITNRSSGKMGNEIAKAVCDRGGKVILVAGIHTVLIDDRCEVIHVSTTEEMFNAVMSNLELADIVIKAAAPADYKVKESCCHKLKSQEMTLHFVKNVDIAKEVGAVKGSRKLVVFAAETDHLVDNAREKLISKNADLVVANDVTAQGAGFDVETNVATLVTNHDEEPLEIMSKHELANKILDKVIGLDN